MLHRVTQPISQGELRERIYSGEILHFTQISALNQFCDSARQICESTLNSSDPVNSHKVANYSDWLKAVYQFQLAANNEQQWKHCKVLVYNLMRLFAIDLFLEWYHPKATMLKDQIAGLILIEIPGAPGFISK